MRVPDGLFVALEGGEGAGKSTLLDSLGRRVRDFGREVVIAREPGGTRIGEAIRDLLKLEGMAAWAEALLFMAARAQLVDEAIRPALESGKVVLCDRFSASTLAYQGHGRDLDRTSLKVTNRIATGGLDPHLTIFLDIDPAEGLSRKAGEEGPIRIGAESLEFHLRVRDGFREMAAAGVPGTWVTLDAAAPAGDVEEAAWKVLLARLRPGLPGSR